MTKNVTPEEYRIRFEEAKKFLFGRFPRKLTQELNEKMVFASENEMYEAAARFRDRIRSVEKLSNKQKVVASADIERDVIAVCHRSAVSAICILYIRGGKLTDSEIFFFSGGEIIDSSFFCFFICEVYNLREFAPEGNRRMRPALGGKTASLRKTGYLKN